MSFEDLEKSIADFFRRKTKTVTADFLVQQETKRFIMRAFADTQMPRAPWWNWLIKPMQAGIAFGLMLIGAFVHTLLPESYAGEVSSTAGMTEIIRDNTVLTVREKEAFKLKVGDVIQVNPQGNARIATKNGIQTKARGGTTLRLADEKNLFVQEGVIEALLSSGNTISTHRGFVSTDDEGLFSMEILPTGEARVVLEDKAIEVSDWLDNKAKLSVTGEELRLKTDTKLSTQKVPQNLKLSDTQLRTIEAKLVIARSKLFTGLEKSLARRNSGRSDIASAEKTFRSILQVIRNTDRQLNVYGNLDLDLVKNSTVLEAISDRTGDSNLIQEAQSFLALLQIVERRAVDFEFHASNEKTFDRYVLTQQLQALAQAEETVLLEHVKNQYVNVSLRTIINQTDRSGQIDTLKEIILNIPVNHPVRAKFLRALNEQLDPVLQEFMTEFTNGSI